MQGERHVILEAVEKLSSMSATVACVPNCHMTLVLHIVAACGTTY